MKRNKLNIAVIGIGYLGKYHLEKFLSHKNCITKWIVDTNDKNINTKGLKDIQITNNYKAVLNDIDAVSIVTPTKYHYEIAKYFLSNKKHVLIEKPMTQNISQAQKLIILAKPKS